MSSRVVQIITFRSPYLTDPPSSSHLASSFLARSLYLLITMSSSPPTIHHPPARKRQALCQDAIRAAAEIPKPSVPTNPFDIENPSPHELPVFPSHATTPALPSVPSTDQASASAMLGPPRSVAASTLHSDHVLANDFDLSVAATTGSRSRSPVSLRDERIHSAFHRE